MRSTRNKIRAAVAATALAAGIGGAALISSAASAADSGSSSTAATATTVVAPPSAPADTGSSSSSTGSSTATPPANAPQGNKPPQGGAIDWSKGGHTANGKTETVLTGDDATKVTAAAQAAVPGGTVERVETDAEGATYEAHVQKADGSLVTVKLDASFNVTSTIDGMG